MTHGRAPLRARYSPAVPSFHFAALPPSQTTLLELPAAAPATCRRPSKPFGSRRSPAVGGGSQEPSLFAAESRAPAPAASPVPPRSPTSSSAFAPHSKRRPARRYPRFA